MPCSTESAIWFQSTPLHEGRHLRPRLRAFALSRRCFNPRPCMRGDSEYCLWSTAVPAQFQSTPLHEGRRHGDVHADRSAFQSTPLHEGATTTLG